MPKRRAPIPVRIREIRDPRDHSLGRAHGLLRRIFPRAELLPLRDWRESLWERHVGLWTDLDWHLLVAEQGQHIVGAASGSYIGNINVGLIGYVGILKELRGRGVGERLRQALRRAIAADARRVHDRRLRALVGEVHRHNPWLCHLVQEKAALALDFPYSQPSLHRTARHVSLVLYYEPLGRRRRTVPDRRGRPMVTRMSSRLLPLAVALTALAATTPRAAAQATPAPRPADTASAATPAPVIFAGETLLVFRARLGPFTAAERATALTARLRALADRLARGADSVTPMPGDGGTDLRLGDEILMTVTDADALADGRPQAVVAAGYARALTGALRRGSRAAALKALALGLVWAGLATVALVLLLRLGGAAFARLERAADRLGTSRVRAIRVQKVELVSAERLAAALRGGVELSRAAAMLVLLYFYLVLVLSLFPWTQHLAGSILGYVLDPLGRAWRAFVAYLPNVFFLAVIALLTRYGLKLVHLVFRSIGSGALTFAGFHAEWAEPTYKIVRFLVFAFAVIVAFPYLPGSGSEAFKGVSIFLGVLFSLGSSSAIGNVVAGVVLTYTRAFQIGDRVQVGATTGDVVEKTLLVTRVRTIKNEDVTIPNAVVLGSHIVNYSAVAHGGGLILHTSVTIGYDAPWQRVHELLVAAARATPGVRADPAPFVLQRSLDDSFVTYEVNAYTDRPQAMAQTYSALHQHIQDRFHEAGVEIMSPHYAALRDGNAAAIPDDRRPPGYRAPAFRVARADPPAREPEAPPAAP